MTTTAYGPTVVTSGLSLLLDAGNTKSYSGSGSTWYDLSPNHYNGTNHSCTYSSSGYFTFSSSYFSIANTTNITHGSNNFAYSCWARWSSKPAYGTIFENGNWSIGNNTLLIRFETNGITIHAVGGYYGKFTFDPTLNTWYNLAFVRNGDYIYFYVNGQQSEVMSFNAYIVPSQNDIWIGDSIHSPTQYFAGDIAVASIYINSLSSTEVAQNFAALRGRFGV